MFSNSMDLDSDQRKKQFKKSKKNSNTQYRKYPNALRMRKGTVQFRIAKILFSRVDSHREKHHFSRKSEKSHKIGKEIAPKFDFALAKNIEHKKKTRLHSQKIFNIFFRKSFGYLR